MLSVMPDFWLSQLVDGMASSAKKHLPMGLFRDFYLWGLQPNGPQHLAFTQISALRQQAKLVEMLLAGLFDVAGDCDRLVSTCALISAWQVYEVVSDNMAIGLGRPCQYDDADIANRRKTLIRFNDVMSARLNKEINEVEVENAIRAMPWRSIPLANLSLSPSAYGDLLAQFAKHASVDPGELDGAAHAQLIANIESCSDLLSSVRHLALQSTIRYSLVGRYRGVNRLATTEEMDFQDLLDVGTHTILVLPTLGFLSEAFATHIGVWDPFRMLVDDGALPSALEDAACLVRLLNDIGTHLLTMSHSDRQQLMLRAGQADPSRGGSPLAVDVLKRMGNERAEFNRIRKDVELDEFNIALHGLLYDRPLEQILPLFAKRLDAAATEFSARKRSLHSNLERIERGLDDARISTLISRFVAFHETLYQNPYDRQDGDYAIA